MAKNSDELLSYFSENFEKHQNPDENETYISDIRIKAMSSLLNSGFPTKKHEEWKYTNISFLFNHDFCLATNKTSDKLLKDDINSFIYEDLIENIIVFVNGYFSPELSKIVSGEKIIIKNLKEGIRENLELIEQFIGINTGNANDAFSNLNTAFGTDGAYIVIPDNSDFAEPVHLLFINDSRDESYISNPRNLILVGENSKVKILESAHTIGTKPAFVNLVTEIVQKANSEVDYYKIQNHEENLHYVGTTAVLQGENSKFDSAAVSLKGKFIRNTLNTKLNGKHAESNFNGFYFIDENDFVDNHTLADHAVAECNSNELYKGILDHTATAVFNGKIIVRPDAQKTNAYQSNKNILLSNDATINTKPQLEIFADDVKCSHGATSGYLDKDSLFYLKARGIPEDKARAMLLNAFASDVVSKINIAELRDNIKLKIADRLNVEDIYFCGIMDKLDK